MHYANYPRKPRGGPPDLAEAFEIRFSLCCGREGCRRRVLPPSVRFWECRVYWAPVMLLVSALRQGLHPDATMERLNVSLRPANRYGGFKALRSRCQAHCRSTLMRPVLLIDEAQQVSAECLTELRLLQSHHFDSQNLLFTILCGDNRLPERFRSPDLLPLGSRIAPRLVLTPLSPEQLQDYLKFALDQAGNAQLMTDELIQTLAAHAANNLRVLNQMAAELLTVAAEQNLTRIDGSLFFQLFSATRPKTRRNHAKQ